MSRIAFDTQKAFLIPDEKRDEYFEWVKVMANYCPGAMSNSNVTQAWNTELDPIIIANSEYFSEKNWKAIEAFMKKIGAKDVTESLS